ncbi:PREDICTED: probable Xaa-Pro aminopeptidase P [Acropora digitifera]|uniref:probable Xaa-Pro aminopeptidase P n=1 Tax=Acropora digitifera TaxID=70779 RepID=UPI00077A0D2A|nr:PREDICTED: probable Xaa-Pro aminopeptidase P [Acropora digitifera]
MTSVTETLHEYVGHHCSVRRTLDVFAREPLWKIGLDYRHGTGHGIGHFLNVHEGPQCIAPGFPGEDEKILMPGMILSDEPGYYEDGSFGIRLETAVLVKSANTKVRIIMKCSTMSLKCSKDSPFSLVFQREKTKH